MAEKKRKCPLVESNDVEVAKSALFVPVRWAQSIEQVIAMALGLRWLWAVGGVALLLVIADLAGALSVGLTPTAQTASRGPQTVQGEGLVVAPPCLPCMSLNGSIVVPRSLCCHDGAPPAAAPSTHLRYYSQFGEDRKVHEQLFRETFGGVFVEIGAFDGESGSNTLFFEEQLDWTGVLIEPSPLQFDKLTRRRRRATICVNAAICSEKRTVHWLDNPSMGVVSGIFEFMSPAFLGSFHQGAATAVKTPLQCMGFDALFEDAALRHIRRVDLFSLDVEGAEFQALQTFPFDRISVSVWLIEADNSNLPKNAKVHALLKAKGFQLFGKIEITEVFVSREFALKKRLQRGTIK
jgi:FkbM family methyltransferase